MAEILFIGIAILLLSLVALLGRWAIQRDDRTFKEELEDSTRNMDSGDPNAKW
jgi:hypothetical protein